MTITVMLLQFSAFWRHKWYLDTILLPNLHNFVPNLHDWVGVILSNLFWIEQGAILYSYEWGLENLYLSLYLGQGWINCAWECELQCFNLSGDLLPIIGILKEAFFMQFAHSMLPSGISILCRCNHLHRPKRRPSENDKWNSYNIAMHDLVKYQDRNKMKHICRTCQYLVPNLLCRGEQKHD